MNNLPLGPINLNPVSNCSIILHPPEPLVLHVEAGGEYVGIQWTRTPIALNVSSIELVDFQQTLFRADTTVNDIGLYKAKLVSSNSNMAMPSIILNVTLLADQLGKYVLILKSMMPKLMGFHFIPQAFHTKGNIPIISPVIQEYSMTSSTHLVNSYQMCHIFQCIIKT